MLDIINIDSDIDARSRLKQMIFAHDPHARIVPAKRLNEAVTRIESGSEFDLLVVSSSFGLDDLNEFLARVRSFPQSQDMLIVTILRGRHADTSVVVQNLMNGIHGCLTEPFSVNSLSELLIRAKQARSVRDQRRRLVAIDFILRDIAKIIDEIARRKANDEGFRYVMKQLRKTCAALTGMGKEFEDDVALAAVKHFAAIDAPKYLVKKKEAVVDKKETKAETAPGAGTSTTARRIIRKG